MTGIIWSARWAIAVVPKVVRDGVFYLSPNAGPSLLAGKGCHENYFNFAWSEVDNLHEAMGQYVARPSWLQERLYPGAELSGSAMTRWPGFKRFFEGAVAGEVYTKLGQKDSCRAEIKPFLAQRQGRTPSSSSLAGRHGASASSSQYAQAGAHLARFPCSARRSHFDQVILGAVGEGPFALWRRSTRGMTGLCNM